MAAWNKDQMTTPENPGSSKIMQWINKHLSYCGATKAQDAEIKRLLRGIANVRDYLDQNRTGDASFDCEALLAGTPFEQKEPITTEQLDQLQFGKLLHKRP